MMRSLLLTAALFAVFVACFLGPLFLAKAFAHVPGCHTRACDRRIHDRRAQAWLKRERPWIYAWRQLSPGAKYWTRCVTSAESNWQRITTGPHHSYFQWNLSTWHSAGGSGMPENATWHHQAVLAWRWHVKVPHGQWPNTGEGGRCGS